MSIKIIRKAQLILLHFQGVSPRLRYLLMLCLCFAEDHFGVNVVFSGLDAGMSISGKSFC